MLLIQDIKNIDWGNNLSTTYNIGDTFKEDKNKIQLIFNEICKRDNSIAYSLHLCIKDVIEFDRDNFSEEKRTQRSADKKYLKLLDGEFLIKKMRLNDIHKKNQKFGSCY